MKFHPFYLVNVCHLIQQVPGQSQKVSGKTNSL